MASSEAPQDPTTARAPTEDLAGQPFGEFLESSYQALLARSPQLITSLGLAGEYGQRNDQLDDLSDSFLRETQQLELGILSGLRTYDRDALSVDDQTSYDVYEWYLDRQVGGHPFMYHDYPVHYFINSYNFNLLLFLTEEHPLDDVDDIEDYIVRVSQINRQVGQIVEGLEIRRGLGIVPPDYVVDWSLSTLQGDLAGGGSRPETVSLYTSFIERTEALNLDGETRQELNDLVLAAVTESFVPAWQALIEHLGSIRASATEPVGLWRLADGDSYYEHLLAFHTTTDMTADEIHELGLVEVGRVQAEMRSAFVELGYPADEELGALRDRARQAGGFLNGDTPEREADVLALYGEMIEAAELAAEPFFSAQPRGELTIVPEPIGQGGYYVPGAADGSRPGSFHAGVQGAGLARYTLATVLYHESIPGHHFQIALAQELDIPDFRRFTRFTGFTEGWALYAERLASEMGLYADDPIGEIGRLELELLRAVRLVVDTGIHSRHWTRAEARAYMVEAMGDGAWAHEVERYVAYPGQATSYMIGLQTIAALRDAATESHGDSFDITQFHDVVLGSGAVPLTVLEQRAAEYIGGENQGR